ncbi:DNA polymerase III subunit gamma and tau [Demequina sp. NBRC 110056]|uniref:DNA polymerase III subunit gamma and tau n=1 Tax=Demequina sp. NBRC 110056 TaxID=1570345 RepID=UPI000A01D56B|nr:DNA polymerase III subunit gamma and tau [Demequina sp. NBRC 110056]
MSTALYRRYRPDAFADVVGQEHVTTPLMQALRADRVNHAYLFSGPRGCGKTTSARILARCLNCEQGPTDTPCGTCDSCVELARGGAGSVDVVEIDAASHNGVDDARELRERAAFAPARDRYKIFILDEAHMVTTQGFNALLKLVEEPPPHVRFIFATTEPEKVIGTIRSRTHHYPFRLVPPAVLIDYLGQLCEAESVQVEGGVLPLVVRAGGGSVRDTLSVLDQLMAGSDEAGVTYERAIALLGFTDATLLDDAVDAIAAGDGASLFDVVGRVIGTGHEPRRFVEDLLERLRDLILLCAAGVDGLKALGEIPSDQLDSMKDQARRLGLARASQAGDLVNDALTHMVGATSPRLHLELLCARLVAAATGAGAPPAAPAVAAAPPAGAGTSAPAASGTGPGGAGADAATGAAKARAAVAAARGEEPQPAAPSRAATEAASVAPPAAPAAPPTPSATEAESTAAAKSTAAAEPSGDAESSGGATAAAEPPRAPEPTPEPQRAEEPAAASAPPASAAPATPAPPQPAPAEPEPVRAPTGDVAGGAEDAELVRRRWPEVLGTLERRRVTWSMVSQSAQVASVSGGVLTLAFDNGALASRFTGSAHAENVALAVRETLGLHVRVEAIQGPGGGRPATTPAAAPAPQRAPSVASPPRPASAPAAVAASGAAVAGAVAASAASDEPPPWDEPPPEDEPSEDAPSRAAAGGASDDHEDMSPDDEQAPDAQLSGADVVAQLLGGTIIED